MSEFISRKQTDNMITSTKFCSLQETSQSDLECCVFRVYKNQSKHFVIVALNQYGQALSN